MSWAILLRSRLLTNGWNLYPTPRIASRYVAYVVLSLSIPRPPASEDHGYVFLANSNAPCTMVFEAIPCSYRRANITRVPPELASAKCVVRGIGSADSGRQSLTNAVERR